MYNNQKLSILDLEIIQNKIITIQGQAVIIYSDVAELYGVETK
jgi:hypothetical protein